MPRNFKGLLDSFPGIRSGKVEGNNDIAPRRLVDYIIIFILLILFFFALLGVGYGTLYLLQEIFV